VYRILQFPHTTFCFFFSAAIAFAILAWTIFKKNVRFGFWIFLAIISQAASLQTIDAGTRLHFQHYRLIPSPWLIVPGIQTMMVAFGLFSNRSTLGSWISRFGWLRSAGVALVLLLSGAALSANPAYYLHELAFSFCVQVVAIGNILMVILECPQNLSEKIKLSLQKLLNTESHRFIFIASCWVFLVSALLNVFIYERHPHVTDEVVYLFQARFLAAGALTLPPPPVPDAFEVNLMEIENGRWYPSPPFGWPAVLAIGVKLGAGWLVNPIVAAINIALSYALLKRMYDENTARICVLLLCISPWFIFLAMSYMTHMLMLACGLAAALSIKKTRETGKIAWALLAGVLVGYVSLIRPLEGVIVGVILGLWVIGFGASRLKFSSIIAFALSTALVGSLVFPYNKYLTGNPTKFPINTYNEKRYGPHANSYGFGPDVGMKWAIDPYIGHGPKDALANSALNASSLNTELLGWSVGSLFPAALFFFGGAFRRDIWTKSDTAMLCVIAAVYIAYFFYYFSGGPDFGARYWFPIIIPLLAFSARGVQLLARADNRVWIAAALLAFMTLINYLPWRAIDKYHDYLGMRPDVRMLIASPDFKHSLIFIRGVSFPDYASAAIYNPLDFQGSTAILAWERDTATTKKVAAAFPDRPIWIVDGPSRTQNGYRVVAGPFTREEFVGSK
jgi:4-amino-4-deoxy-L-arabinose transferase-like glycosyltransferase